MHFDENTVVPISNVNNVIKISQKRIKLNEKTGEIETDNEADDNVGEGIQTNDISSGNVCQDVKKTKSRITLNEITGEFYEVEEIVEEDDAISNNDEKVKEKRGKKKTREPGNWKKNIAKKKNVKNHIRREIPTCRCKCKEKLSEKEAISIFDKFISFSSHTDQNIYLQGCLQETNPARFRPTKSPTKARPRKVFKYHVSLKKRTVELCQQAFLAIHGIKRERLQRKVQQKNKDITDLRGKQSHSIYSQDVIKKVHKFIEGIPARESHYSRESSKHKKYVDSNLSVAELHRKFKHDNPDIEIKYSKFNEIFNKDFNIAFGHPRKDICATCEKLKVQIDFATVNKEVSRLNSLKVEKELHLRKAETFFKSITKAESDKQNHKLSLCFDYQKNLALPVTNVSIEYYSRQLWLHNFGVHNLSDNTASMYLYTENYGLKGPNEVITALADYIEHKKLPEHTHLELFCDNCFSQNKNRYLFTFLDQLCANNIFQKVTVSYPIPGHSMMPIDRDFALIERKRIKMEKVYTPNYYIDLIENSRNTQKFEVIFLEKNLREEEKPDDRVLKIKNYKTLYEMHIKPSVSGISMCRKVQFQRFRQPEFSTSMTGQNYKKMTLYRVGMGGRITDEIDDCYRGTIPLKPAKINDIRKLLEYVPIEKRTFYNDIVSAAASSTKEHENENDDTQEEIYE